MIKKYFYILLFLVIGIAQFTVQAQSISQLKNERKQIERKLQKTEKTIKETKNNEKQSIKKLNILKQGIVERKALINNYNSEINLLDNKINRLSSEHQSLEKDLARIKKDYVRLLQKAQVNKNVYSKLMFVLSSDNFEQSMRRLRYLNEITGYEREQGEKIKSIQKQLVLKSDSLATHKSSKVEAVKQKQVESSKLQKDQKNETVYLANLQKKEKNLTSEYQSNQQKIKNINAKIESIIAEQIRQEEARKKAAEEARKRKLEAAKKAAESKAAISKSGGENTTATTTSSKNEPTLSTDEIERETREENLLSGSFARNKGRLPWPVAKGSISGHFGIQPHPVLSKVTINNKGTYFQSPSGTTARAVYSGEVTTIFSTDGAWVVIVQHGSYRTVYSNLSAVYVKIHQKVSEKQAIGKIYSDRDTGKTELYFQIWNGRNIQNPESWIAR